MELLKSWDKETQAFKKVWKSVWMLQRFKSLCFKMLKILKIRRWERINQSLRQSHQWDEGGTKWRSCLKGLPWWLSGKASICQYRRRRSGLGRSHMPWAAKSVSNKQWACALESGNCNCWAHLLQLLKAVYPGATMRGPTATWNPRTAT